MSDNQMAPRLIFGILSKFERNRRLVNKLTGVCLCHATFVFLKTNGTGEFHVFLIN